MKPMPDYELEVAGSSRGDAPAMTLLYFIVPFLIIFSTGNGTLRSIWQVVQWLYLTLLTEQPTAPLTEILGQELGRFLSRSNDGDPVDANS